MARSIKYCFALTGLYLSCSAVVYAATTQITANISDGSCEVTIPNGNLTFDNKRASEFSSAMTTVELHHLNVELSCAGTAGIAPVLNVTGESAGLADARLFRSASSEAKGVGFMLKQGTLTDLPGFYTANGTVAPGDSVSISQDNGMSTQPFTVGLVRGKDEAIPSAGAISGKISFTFAYP